MTMIHSKKKDVVKSKVRGVEVEFDHEKLATILGIPGNNGICEYVKDVWEESKYIKPLEITRRKDHESPYGDWMTMVFKLLEYLSLTRKVGRKRRRDDDIDVLAEEEVEKEEENRIGFDWEAIIDEAATEGESGSDDQFYDAQVREEEPVTETPTAPAVPASSSAQQKDQEPAGVDPSGPTSREADFLKFQAEFERKRANRFHDELEKAKAENAKLLALLHQAQTKPHP
ncbi:hypothetical protein Dimus_037309 [Dionaea muscipula]